MSLAKVDMLGHWGPVAGNICRQVFKGPKDVWTMDVEVVQRVLERRTLDSGVVKLLVSAQRFCNRFNFVNL